MEWLYTLFFGNGIAHAVLIFALVITIGILLGKVKIGGISLGVTWILFVGILFSHFGMTVNGEVRHFVQEFGLILFVFSIGLQVGPGFFASFKHGGITLVGCATAIVLLGVATAYVIHVVTGTPIPTMVGILSGAVTNTPGLGAAQQAYADALRMLNDAAPSEKVIALKSLEAFQKAADGKATKIIIPSEIQSLAGLATSVKEVFHTEDVQNK